ncbi:MAG: Undecaprenyl phosphate N,N'-diacetylbacillosamine 1-phosphate transferase [Candidatus Izimaplasma bacterium HR2]|nr:MAG: Undecaprenyl phosphate N,N'-diacetylbacillosamine 1-phosphate transferase [Candidatus Izimaplasma bacterium HR2]
MIYLKFKRFYDFVLALLGVSILFPLFLILVLLIKVDSKGPIIFKQKRIGKDKEYFNIYKFRTMKVDTPKNTPTHLLENPNQWITRMGKFMRKSSLDEIPQFFNILKGDMSFVGPRPALWNQYDLIEERDKYGVHKVSPGVTGWAQVSGRDKLLIADKAKLDGEYLKHLNLFTDIKLVIYTFIVVFKRDGVVEGGTGLLEKETIIK